MQICSSLNEILEMDAKYAKFTAKTLRGYAGQGIIRILEDIGMEKPNTPRKKTNLAWKKSSNNKGSRSN